MINPLRMRPTRPGARKKRNTRLAIVKRSEAPIRVGRKIISKIVINFVKLRRFRHHPKFESFLSFG